MNNKIGVMQGRLLPKYQGRYQAHPVGYWQDEFIVAKEVGLKYVYLGNVPGHPWEHTYCSECNEIVVKRYGFDIKGWFLDEKNNCKFCGNPIPITGKLQKEYKQQRFQMLH